MGNIKHLRPSPALLVAMAALVFAMSGAALGLAGKNTVNSGDIKNGKVKGKDLAKNAVKGSKVKDESLSDKDIGDYEVLGNSFTRVVATEGATELAAQTAAPETTLFKKGQLEVYAKCFRDTSGTPEVRGEIYARTSADGAIMDGEDSLPEDDATLLNTTTLEEDRELETEDVSAADEGDTSENEHLLTSPDGTALVMQLVVAVKQGTLPTGNGAFGDGNVCLFGGEVVG